MNSFYFIFFLATFAYVQADDCNCRFRTSKRIVNGQVSIKNSIPWIVSLAQNEEHICGGSILNEKFILTAAHCTEKRDVKNLFVRVGIYNVKEEIPNENKYEVKKVHVKKFKDITHPGDIAILELSRNINFIDGAVQKGCFNLQETNYTKPLLAAGWGMTELSYYDQENKKWLLEGEPEYLKQAFFAQNFECNNPFICVKPLFKGDSICHGDDGGPLHNTEGGVTKIEGIAGYVTGTKKVDDKDYYCSGDAVYSRLSYYAEWINKVTDHSFCGASEKKKSFGFF